MRDPMDLFDALLPVKRAKQAHVLVSTKRNVYGTSHPVPDAGLLKEPGRRCRKVVTTDGQTGTSVDVTM